MTMQSYSLSFTTYEQFAETLCTSCEQPVPRAQIPRSTVGWGDSQPPATILMISSRSPADTMRRGNSDGTTASPLCSTTTLLGSNSCPTRNSSTEQGSRAVTFRPFAITQFSAIIAQIRYHSFQP